MVVPVEVVVVEAVVEEVVTLVMLSRTVLVIEVKVADFLMMVEEVVVAVVVEVVVAVVEETVDVVVEEVVLVMLSKRVNATVVTTADSLTTRLAKQLWRFL